jgi:hypothetical protein
MGLFGDGAPVAPKNRVESPMGSDQPIGDRAGEYLVMPRGQYDAWVYVVFAFVYTAGLIFAIVGGLAALSARALDADAGTVEGMRFALGGVVGVGGAWFIFHDRWRCIEAHASRFCSGVMNLSLIYVPIIAFFYAQARFVKRLRGR